MMKSSTETRIPLSGNIQAAWQDVDSSFERFCLTTRVGYRWGTTKGKIGFHGGKVAVHRPRVRSYDGREVELPTWTAAQTEDWLGRWAMNLMLINVSTRKLRRAVRLPDGDLPAVVGDGTSKS